MTQVDLESALPQTTVMVVSVTGSTTSGRPLPETDLQECLKVRAGNTKTNELTKEMMNEGMKKGTKAGL